MKESIYQYSEYKPFLNDLIRSRGSAGRGVKAALAQALSCQSPFVSQVLSGDLDFSTDQGLACAVFFGLNRDETEYLLLLVGKAKAATPELRKHLQQSIDAKKDAHRMVKKRMKMKDSVDEARQARYYSSWMYAAIHMVLTIPEYRTREAISGKFQLSLETVDQVLEFLIESGLVEKKGTEFSPTGLWYHLEKKSPLINQHHTNLHLRSLQSLNSPSENDVHYSAFFSCSKQDLAKLEEVVLQMLSEFNSIVRPSPEEVLTAININLFRV